MQLYQRPRSPFWWWTATVNGERIRESTGVADRQAADRIARARLRDAERRVADAAAGIAPPSTITLAQLAAAYLTDAATRLSRKSWVTFSCLTKTHILPGLGEQTQVRTITKERAAAFRSSLLAGTGGRPGVRAKSANNILATLRLMFKFGVEQGYLPANPLAELSPLKVRTQAKFRALQEAEVQRWLVGMSPGNRLWVRFMIATGLRNEEAEVIEHRHVERQHSRLMVPVMDDWAIAEDWSPKSGRTRYVPLTAAAIKVLDELGPGVGLIWGARQRRTNLATAWRLAELPGRPATAHDLRHTAASMAAARGLTLTQMMEWFGWTSASVAQRYLHLYGPAWKEMAEKMNEADPTTTARATIESAVAGLPSDVAARVLAALGSVAASVPTGVPHATTQGADMALMTGSGGSKRGRKPA